MINPLPWADYAKAKRGDSGVTLAPSVTKSRVQTPAKAIPYHLARTFRGKPVDYLALQWLKKTWMHYRFTILNLIIALALVGMVYHDWITLFVLGRLPLALLAGFVFLLGNYLPRDKQV